MELSALNPDKTSTRSEDRVNVIDLFMEQYYKNN